MSVAANRRSVDVASALRPLSLAPREKWQLGAGGAAGSLVFLIFVGWALHSPDSLKGSLGETGWIEISTAASFILSSAFFIAFALRSETLAARGTPLIYFFTLGWAALAFVCGGEEISWGQHLFGFATPEEIAEGNRQNEFNLHNHVAAEALIGRHGWRAISVLTVVTGVAMPLMAQTAGGRRLFQRLGLPTCPLCYMPLFVASYAFVKLVMAIAPDLAKAAEEVRELFLAAGFLAFSLHGALRPADLLRVTR